MSRNIIFISFFVICGLLQNNLEANDTQLTIYNQNFAVVKGNRILELKKGENELRVTDITAYLEPESVILRDTDNPESLKILEQNYESDPLSEGLLLKKSEGKILDFEIANPKTGEKEIIKGKIIRSGYVPQYPYAGYGQSQAQPIIEVNGKIQFGLPGKPVFDSIESGGFLKPTLLWNLWTSKAGKHNVEFSYLTNEISWVSSYNAVMPEKRNKFDIIGWITINNRCGMDFDKTSVKLIAGDVSRVQQEAGGRMMYAKMAMADEQVTTVRERSFEEYHLYTLGRLVTILDKEIKQIEFIRANNVSFQRFYVYDGFETGQYAGRDSYSARDRSDYGTICNKKVRVMLEFKNSEANHLGIPLPKGKVKIYRKDIDGRNEFTGEDQIDHTATDETVKLYMGNAFDIVGERKQTNFYTDSSRKYTDESFEIKLRNRKKEEVSIRVIEHLYRWTNWEIKENNIPYTKKDSKTIEFNVKIPANGEKTITYTAHYSW